MACFFLKKNYINIFLHDHYCITNVPALFRPGHVAFTVRSTCERPVHLEPVFACRVSCAALWHSLFPLPRQVTRSTTGVAWRGRRAVVRARETSPNGPMSMKRRSVFATPVSFWIGFPGLCCSKKEVVFVTPGSVCAAHTAALFPTLPATHTHTRATEADRRNVAHNILLRRFHKVAIPDVVFHLFFLMFWLRLQCDDKLLFCAVNDSPKERQSTLTSCGLCTVGVD